MIYAVVASLWILFSDRILERLFSPDLLSQAQTFKGLAYVGFTATLLYFMLRAELRAYMRLHEAFNAAERQYSDALRRNEARLRAITAQMPASAWTTNESLIITGVFGATYERLGLSPESYLNRSLYEVFKTSDPKAGPIAAHLAALEGQPGNYELASRGLHFDVHVEPLRDADEQIIGCISVAVEVTTRKQFEARMNNLNAELEQRVRARTAALEATNRELEAFSYSVSHDLRAPLRAIDGFAQMLTEDYAANLDAEALRYLGVVRKNAQHMGQLIDSLLALSRINRQTLVVQQVATEDIVQRVLDDLLPTVAGRNIELNLLPLPPCHADPALLRQVYFNLLANAFKFTRTRDRAKIEIGCKQTESESIYYVDDNGVGFDMRYAQRLFGVFQRLHRTEEFEGTGAGLAIVQRIIQRHGGRVWAQAELDKGAIFYFTIGTPIESTQLAESA